MMNKKATNHFIFEVFFVQDAAILSKRKKNFKTWKIFFAFALVSRWVSETKYDLMELFIFDIALFFHSKKTYSFLHGVHWYNYYSVFLAINI